MSSAKQPPPLPLKLCFRLPTCAVSLQALPSELANILLDALLRTGRLQEPHQLELFAHSASALRLNSSEWPSYEHRVSRAWFAAASKFRCACAVFEAEVLCYWPTKPYLPPATCYLTWKSMLLVSYFIRIACLRDLKCLYIGGQAAVGGGMHICCTICSAPVKGGNLPACV